MRDHEAQERAGFLPAWAHSRRPWNRRFAIWYLRLCLRRVRFHPQIRQVRAKRGNPLMDADKCRSPTTSAATSPLPNATLIGYDKAMTTKEIALKTIEQLPESASWEDIQERINFIVGVRKGLRQLDEGQGIPHDKVKEEFAEWLTN